MHDLTVAFTIWGFLDANPPAELVAARSALFIGVGHGHHYAEARTIADMVPETTLMMTPQQVAGQYPANWRTLLGLTAVVYPADATRPPGSRRSDKPEGRAN